MLPLAALCCSLAAASPTANEFEECHHQAASVLSHCLDSNPGTTGEACWTNARQRNDACYLAVRKRHGRDDARVQAEKKAREAAAVRAAAEQGKP